MQPLETQTPRIIIGVLLLALVVLAVVAILYRRRAKQGGGSAATAHLEDTLRDEKLKSSIILSAIEDGVVMIDEDRIIRSFNQGASDIVGWPVAEALSLQCDAVLKLVDDKNTPYTAEKDPFQRIFQVGQTIHDNNSFLVTRNNKQVPISLRVSPLLDEAGKVSAAVGVFRDVSQERAEEARRAEFISTASHEMRTPVAAIEGYLALALNNKVSTIDTRARSYLEKAHASTQHLGQLFQDLLTSAKAEDGRLSSHPVVVDMSAFLEQLAQDLKFSADKKGLFSEFVLGASDVIDASSGANVVKPLYYVYADPDRLREVITNLFDNACKYTPEGKITLGITANKEVVQFYIKDTGSGIPAEDIPHLFQKFYRVDNSSTRTVGGTGLGLFICRKIIELYNGHLWVESEVNKGSTFFCNLPRIDSARAEQLKAAESSGHPVETSIPATGNVM